MRATALALLMGMALSLGACGSTTGTRAVTGGLMGAGAGAGVSALTGGRLPSGYTTAPASTAAPRTHLRQRSPVYIGVEPRAYSPRPPFSLFAGRKSPPPFECPHFSRRGYITGCIHYIYRRRRDDATPEAMDPRDPPRRTHGLDGSARDPCPERHPNRTGGLPRRHSPGISHRRGHRAPRCPEPGAARGE